MAILRFLAVAALFMLAGVFLVRGIQAFRGPPLSPWHTQVPAEPGAAEIDSLSWAQWLAREDRLFAETAAALASLPAEARVPANRFWAESPVSPARLPVNWNRSYTLSPEGPARGVAVMLHGLTDSPYSLRHVARLYQEAGFHVVGIRLPGHGTVPAGLTRATVADWQAATALAVREARRLQPTGPLHLVGYSNGAALALRHSLQEGAPGAPSQIILLSPMIGLTPFARFSGVAGWPAILPPLANAAWLDLLPEFNPFKYNSFPVEAARQAQALTAALANDMDRAERAGRLAALPPVLTVQSAVDFTVSTPAVLSGLHDRLPPGRADALILFDINHAAPTGVLLRASARDAAARLLPPRVRPYSVTLVTNESPTSLMAVARTTPAGATASTDSPIGIAWPADVHSLSHIAIPFPPSDGLYGSTPDPADNQGVALGAIAARGETGTLSVGMEFLARQSSNPFWPWVETRIAATLPPPPAE